MVDHSGPDHIQVYIDKALDQMLPGFHGGGVIAIFPEGPSPILPEIVFLSGSAGRQLDGFRDGIWFSSFYNKEMNVVGSGRVVQDPEPIAFFSLKKPGQPPPPVFREPQQELLLVAAMGDVPDISRNVISIRSRHSGSLAHSLIPLISTFFGQKMLILEAVLAKKISYLIHLIIFSSVRPRF